MVSLYSVLYVGIEKVLLVVLYLLTCICAIVTVQATEKSLTLGVCGRENPKKILGTLWDWMVGRINDLRDEVFCVEASF